MKELTKAEEQIMRVIWKEGPVFIKDIIDQLPEPKPAYNTVGTFLKILEDKGFVARKKYGGAFQYHPLVAKSKYTSFLMKGFVSKYFEGSVENMFSHFIKNKELDLKTFEELSKKYKDEEP
ncbi:Transcriptional regulator, MecI family [Fulvivirga imtechensis AK7]|uniref:Transcriptional regulator, MecI family n=1 Tax=Fulvivirga imtechensis AK7 TaxID=1237149 RepID=L8JS40_9BACT|nr:BlaI/MecI/CopY family transcriptional regulator [Fulvivirga imtechensis]ELR70289.1 Transcriptional regulator, MecI family [Fulvivirga imtechensis AK7]